MPDTDDTEPSEPPSPRARTGGSRSRTAVTWRGIVDVPEEPAPKRAPLKGVGGAINRGLSAVGITRPKFDDGSRGPRKTKRLAGLAGTIAVVALLVSMGHVVSAGTVAVPETLGSAGAPLDEGFHLTAPWPLTTVSTMSIRTQNYTMTAADVPGTDDPVVVLGKDGASGAVDATLLYRLEPDRATDVYREVGTDFSTKLVQPTARSCIRTVFAGYDMVSAATESLDEVSDGISTCIAEGIEPIGIALVDFQLRDVTLGEDVQAAIDAKVSAQQKAESQRFEVATAQRQADIATINAQARADSAQILACGGTLTRVERNGETVDVVVPNPPDQCAAPALSPEMLQYDYIQALREIIKSPNNSTIVVPEGQDLSPVIDGATATPGG